MAVATGVERPRGRARREALLRAVLRIVGEVGPEAVTHRRVAEVAGLPLASTTYWFSSKDELLAAALELAAQNDEARLRRATARRIGGDPVDAVVAVLAGPVGGGVRASRPSLIAAYALWLEAARRPGLQQLATRWTDTYRDCVAALLDRAGVPDPSRIARLIVAAADGLVMDQLVRGAPVDLEDQLRELTIALTERPHRRRR